MLLEGIKSEELTIEDSKGNIFDKIYLKLLIILMNK
jgi:hypothetical protein